MEDTQPTEEVYYNDSLTSNLTSLELDRNESPLPTEVTELDKIIRAGKLAQLLEAAII